MVFNLKKKKRKIRYKKLFSWAENCIDIYLARIGSLSLFFQPEGQRPITIHM